MNTLYLTNGGNTGISCSPACVSSVPNKAVPSSVCVYPSYQDIALCGLVAATNIQYKACCSQWSCTTSGFTSTNPCTASWTGVICSGSTVISLNIGGYGISGKF